MTSQKPYLIRAIYEWCTDNKFTPFLAIVVNSNTNVPLDYVDDQGKMVLNIDSNATKDFIIDNNWITFVATFAGVVHNIAIPIANVIAIFAKEVSQGMQFEFEENAEIQEQTNHADTKPTGLKLIK